MLFGIATYSRTFYKIGEVAIRRDARRSFKLRVLRDPSQHDAIQEADTQESKSSEIHLSTTLANA